MSLFGNTCSIEVYGGTLKDIRSKAFAYFEEFLGYRPDDNEVSVDARPFNTTVDGVIGVYQATVNWTENPFNSLNQKEPA